MNVSHPDVPRHIAEGVAHDFYNIVGLIKNYAKLLGRDITPECASDPRVREDLSNINEAVAQSEILARALMTFSHSHEPLPSIFNLNDLVRENQILLESFPAVEVGFSLEEDLRLIKADRGQIQQVLWNLVTNSREAMGDSGGTITIETKNGSTDKHIFCVTLVVTDDGPGIPLEIQDRIFLPFFSTKFQNGDSGTSGWGLATIHGVVDNACGSITLDSAPGQGTNFTVCLPAGVCSGSHPVAQATT